MLQDLAEEYRFQILAMEVMPDHIHMLVDCRPQFYISDMIKIMKGNLARQMFLYIRSWKKETVGRTFCGTRLIMPLQSVTGAVSRYLPISEAEGKRKEKALNTGVIPETFGFCGKVEEDADSIQLWCGDTKTEYPGPPDTGNLPVCGLLPDRNI